MKTVYNSISAIIGCCLLASTSMAQISFTNQVSSLSDPTHYSGNAVAVQDVNSDGLDDIIILDDARDLRIEYQKMDGVWTSYTGSEIHNGGSWSMVVGDIHNSGYSSVLSGTSGGNPDYAKVNGTGTAFTYGELTGYGLFLQGSNLADIDGDGDLDYFGCADTDESAIWENDGSGNFSNGTNNGLIDLRASGWDGSGNYGSTFTDYDLDGDLDLYISHCRQGVSSSSDERRINQLYENDGNNNYTEDFTNANGLRIGAQSWTTDFQDIDNDGDFDAFMTHHDVDNMLLRNDNGVFNDIFSGSGLDMSVGTPIQGIMKDFDNDMYVDILVTGSDNTTTYAYYKNNGDNTFTRIDGVFGGSGMYSPAVGDLNHDGFLDVYGSYGSIYNNPGNTPDAVWINDGNDNNWLAVDLEGTISNRSAVGSVIRMYGPWGMQVREVRAGESYGISNSLIQHFGLAQNTTIDSVVVDWPSSGIHQVVANPTPNQFLAIIENECVAPEAFITSNGPTVLCQGETLDLMAPAGSGYTYEWSDGSTGQQLTINSTGTYMVRVTDTNSGPSCTSLSAAIQVEVSPDETPEVTVTGDLSFCEGGSVTLTSSDASAYNWSGGLGNTQSVEATEEGSYSVTITGVCGDFTSSSIAVDVIDAPAPTSNDVMIPGPGTADLTATGTGSDFYWYDQASNGTLLGTGANYTTPTVNSTTSFFVEEVHTIGGGTTYGAKTNNSTGGVYHNSTGFYNFFDVYENCTLKSVKVYADGTDDRTLYIDDSNGTEVHSETFSIPDGESRVDLDWALTPGTDYRFRIVEGNHGLWRDENGAEVNYPYDISSLVSITGANTGQPIYYYYFYDWEVEAESFQCISDRTEVVVSIGTVGIEEGELMDASIYPNPTSHILNISIPANVEGKVDLRLIDVSGNLVQSTQVVAGNNQITVSGLATGVYMLEMNTDTGLFSRRIIVQ